MRHRPIVVRSALVLGISMLGAAGCGPERSVPTPSAEPRVESPSSGTTPVVEPLEVPAPSGVRAPELRTDGDGALLTWLREEGDEHVLELVRWSPTGWGEVREIVRGSDLFANWADRPGVVRSPDGALVAWWLAKLGADTYAYGIHLARSEDGGGSWSPLGLLHPDDRSETEHGFAAFLPDPASGDLRAFWLDGRAMAEGGSMQLRTARVGPAGAGASEVLDDRVCECCALDAATSDRGPLVAFRDRSPTEVRDIALVGRSGEGWSDARRVAEDGWTIHGCPVNGPALVGPTTGADGAVVWYTAADERARVRVAGWSTGPGAAMDLDDRDPLGRVDAVRGPRGGIWASWLARSGAEAEVVVRGIEDGRPDGEPISLGRTSSRRASGVPRLEAVGNGLLAVWIDDDAQRLRAARLTFREP